MRRAAQAAKVVGRVNSGRTATAVPAGHSPARRAAGKEKRDVNMDWNR